MAKLKKLINDQVTLVKANGKVAREDIPAHVQPELIVIMDVTVPLEMGDHLLRTLNNGNVEDFIVDHPTFYATFRTLPDHSQVKVHRYFTSNEISKSLKASPIILKVLTLE